MIFVNEPVVGPREVEYVLECLRTGWISASGRFTDEFEKKFAAYCGMGHGIAVSSGTAALEVAVNALRLKPGDEVILPTFTIISCPLAVLRAGGRPVLVDSDPRTWTMDPGATERAVTPRTRAIMPVHIYGHPCEMDAIWEIAQRHDLLIIEDAAEAHGAEYKGKKVGGLGHVSCFSFYANKVITTGEGGMVLTDDAEIASRARSLRNLYFIPERRFFHPEIGNNFRLSNILAAIGLAQVERIEELVEKKRWIGRCYNEQLGGVEGIQLPVEEPWAKNIYWSYGLVLDDDFPLDGAGFSRELARMGVETRPFFVGMHEQPAFLNLGLFQGEKYPVAERLARRGLYLPSGIGLTEEQLLQVVKAVKAVIQEWE